MTRGRIWSRDGNGLCLTKPEPDLLKYRLDPNLPPF